MAAAPPIPAAADPASKQLGSKKLTVRVTRAKRKMAPHCELQRGQERQQQWQEHQRQEQLHRASPTTRCRRRRRRLQLRQQYCSHCGRPCGWRVSRHRQKSQTPGGDNALRFPHIPVRHGLVAYIRRHHPRLNLGALPSIATYALAIDPIFLLRSLFRPLRRNFNRENSTKLNRGPCSQPAPLLTSPLNLPSTALVNRTPHLLFSLAYRAAHMAPPGVPSALPSLVPERSNSPHHDTLLSSSTSLQCCCGRVDCAFLKNNCSVLETVEKDVHTAAQLGQALLARHEAYMADAERDRVELTTRIERLETDKQHLEAENASKIEENRNLLDHLEMLNGTVADSDSKIKALEASLFSSQQAVRRLESAAARAADTDRHLAALEEEQDRLHKELRTSREDARTHAQRCKEAQRGILDMQDQLERMEAEARQERDRHAEVVGRMERQREVNKQLDTAAGRLKGAAATKSIGDHSNGNKIVGHFVRDLLQDNANLQLGIAELREMLMNSNDEIQSLREQLAYHQPLPDQHNDSPASTLKAELEPQQESVNLSQELHIHHHYHVTPQHEIRRPKKKRAGLLPGIFTPPAPSKRSAAASTDEEEEWTRPSSPVAPALLSHTAGEITPTLSNPTQHWREFSNPPSDFSSVPSSPQSNRRSYLFDQSAVDSDVLNSPSTSYDPMSPSMQVSHNKRPSVSSSLSFQSLSRLDGPLEPPALPQITTQTSTGPTIKEEDENLNFNDGLSTAEESTPTREDHPSEDSAASITDGSEFSGEVGHVPRPRIHRSTSHESIMSLSGGLDIHTLKVRPSQLALRPLGGADAVVTGITARPILSKSSNKRSDVALRDHFAGFRSPRAVSGPISERSSPAPSSFLSPGAAGGLGKWVGWRPWGGGSSSEPRNETLKVPEANENVAKDKSKAKRKENDSDAVLGRAAGINQPGAIPGFQEYWASQKRKGAPAKVTAETIDRAALVESLGD